jgi:TolB-like protein
MKYLISLKGSHALNPKVSFHIRRNRKALLILSWFMMALLLTPFYCISAISSPIRLIIFPFDIHSERNLDFIQEGMLKMLSSRLAFKDEVLVIDSEALLQERGYLSSRNFSEEKASLEPQVIRDIARQMDADYILTGNLTDSDNHIKIKAVISNVNTNLSPIPFFAQSPDMNGIIPAMNQLADHINHNVFGRQTYIEKSYKDKNPPLFDIYTHPEKLIEKNFLN